MCWTEIWAKTILISFERVDSSLGLVSNMILSFIDELMISQVLAQLYIFQDVLTSLAEFLLSDTTPNKVVDNYLIIVLAVNGVLSSFYLLKILRWASE